MSEIKDLIKKHKKIEAQIKKIKIGRARMFEDKTKDLDDPGMYALSKLTTIF